MEFEHLNTQALDAFLNQRQPLLHQYDAFAQRYQRTIVTLETQWRGKGAQAFFNDAHTIYANIVGIQDTLTTLCDVLTDCRAAYGDCDHLLGNANQGAG